MENDARDTLRLNDASPVEEMPEPQMLGSHSLENIENITRLCRSVFGVEGVYLSLVDFEHQGPKSRDELEMALSPHVISLCCQTIKNDDVLVIEDVAQYLSVLQISAGTHTPHFRFYAGAPLRALDGKVVGVLYLIHQEPRQFSQENANQLTHIASLAMSQMLLRRSSARGDPWTRLPNKYQLQEDLEALARRCEIDAENGNGKAARALAYVDMPEYSTGFEIASVLGIQAYDDLIYNVAQRLQRLLAGYADVYHICGSRFALLSVGDSSIDLEIKLREISSDLEEPISSITLPINVACYGGIVRLPYEKEALLDARRKAVSALHEALLRKRRWVCYDEDADMRHQRCFRLLNDIPKAIHSDEGFQLVYQPKLDLKNDTYHGVEALLRWTHYDLGAISPAEFIPLAERTALIRPISDWVVATAFRQMAAWRKQDLHLKMAINLSALNFEESDIVERLVRACIEWDVDPHMVEIECTEGIWMQSTEVIEKLHQIRSLGMGLALDDFGTGYSNFAYLQMVPATVVKIDRSLIRNLHSNLRGRRIVQTLILLAKELGYQTVAEGVETAETLQLIREWGVDEAQGYHLARPLTATALFEQVSQENEIRSKLKTFPGREVSRL